AEYFSYTADREQAVTECFVNCLGIWRRLNRDLPYLAEQIKENEEIIDHLFEAFGLDWKAQKMLEGFLQVQQVSAAIREKGSALLSQITQVNQATWSQLKEWYSLVTLQEQRFPEPSPLTLYSDDKLGFSPYFRRDAIHSFSR
ncbi:MAG: hypothetical protein KDK65_01705, partial [Chlamydiia bacterium]|nr:hypothetical protein [Chlamydiia bacterium]